MSSDNTNAQAKYSRVKDGLKDVGYHVTYSVMAAIRATIYIFGKAILNIIVLVFGLLIAAMFCDYIYLGSSHENVFFGIFMSIKPFISPTIFFIFILVLLDKLIFEKYDAPIPVIGAVADKNSKSDKPTCYGKTAPGQVAAENDCEHCGDQVSCSAVSSENR